MEMNVSHFICLVISRITKFIRYFAMKVTQSSVNMKYQRCDNASAFKYATAYFDIYKTTVIATENCISCNLRINVR